MAATCSVQKSRPIARSVCLAAALVCVAAHSARAGDKPLWLAVTTEQLAPAIQPLAEHRRNDGLEVQVFVGQPQDALAKFAEPAYLLLVGDVPAADEEAEAAWFVEAKEYSSYRWIARQRETFMSDSMWGELDGDHIPDVPVGRIPARTPDEAALVVGKVIAYEQRPWSTDDLRLPTWTGAPLASAEFDSFATGLIIQQLKSRAPRWGEISLICGDGKSAFCGWPAEQAVTFNQWLKLGGLVATVGAHGNEDSWLSLANRDQWIRYRVGESDRELMTGAPTCPLIVLTCSSGNFASDGRCVTESMVLAAGGPVAAAGATNESHPLTNYLTARGMQTALLAEPRRLGDLWLESARRGYALRDLIMEPLLKNMEGSIDEQIDVAKLRRDQLRMYALLGDPATKIRAPKKLTASIERNERGWRWTAERPLDATALYVDHRTDIAAPPNRPTDIDRQQAIALHEQANRMFAFRRLGTYAADAPWQGEITEGGEIRLAALGPDCWYVAVLKAAKP